MKTVECFFFMTNCYYTFSNISEREKPDLLAKIPNFVLFNHKKYCFNVKLNIMKKQ